MALTKVTTGGIKDGTITNEDISTTTSISQDKLAATPGASSIASGLMIPADKNKLDGVADNANNYSHPSAHTVSEVTGLQGLLDGKTTETYVNTQITNVIGAAPAALDTLTELAAALGDDANFATTVTTALAGKVDDSQVLTNVPAGALFTDTNTVYTHPTTHPASMLTGALPAIDGSNLTGINAVAVGTTLPSPVSDEGSLFYKSDTDIFYISNGTQWNLVSNASPATTGGTVTIDALSEGSSASYDVDTNFSYPTGSTFSAYSLLSGSLPSGLSFNTSTGVISGTMGEVASTTAYSFTIRGTDTDGDIADQNYSWSINNIAAFTKANLSSMPHSGVNVTEAGSPKINTYGFAALSVVGGDFGAHDGHEGSPADWPAYWAVYLGTAKAVNKLVISVHSNSFGNFELQGSNNANTSGTFYNTGTWTSLTFDSASSTYSVQNGGGQGSGISDHTKLTSRYVNNTAYTHYRVWFKNTYRPNGGGSQHGGWASYDLSLERV